MFIRRYFSFLGYFQFLPQPASIRDLVPPFFCFLIVILVITAAYLLTITVLFCFEDMYLLLSSSPLEKRHMDFLQPAVFDSVKAKPTTSKKKKKTVAASVLKATVQLTN